MRLPSGWFRHIAPGLGALSLVLGWVFVAPPMQGQTQAQDGGTITLRSDVQEANAITGVITARGNVQIDYPARQITATSAQAEYYSNEQRIVLSGNVLINQAGNTLRAETATYLIDQGQFVALPNPNEQVEAVYNIPASTPESIEDEAVGNGAAAGQSVPRAIPPVMLDVSPLETPQNGTDRSAPLE
jgi:lipopolysaccharide export system protein LptA